MSKLLKLLCLALVFSLCGFSSEAFASREQAWLSGSINVKWSIKNGKMSTTGSVARIENQTYDATSGTYLVFALRKTPYTSSDYARRRRLTSSYLIAWKDIGTLYPSAALTNTTVRGNIKKPKKGSYYIVAYTMASQADALGQYYLYDFYTLKKRAVIK